MHTVEILEDAVRVARRLGYKVRTEWLSGVEGGSCEIRGQKWLFIDPAQSVEEQLAQVIAALRHEPALSGASLSGELGKLCQLPKAA